MDSTPWRVGDLLDERWRIHRIQGGGQASVYIAFDEKARLPVVLRASRERRASFRAEAARYNGIPHHPNVCTVYEARVIDGRDVIVLGYIDGGDLRDCLRQGPLGAEAALRIGLAVVDGMMHLRAHGIAAHGDLKPENVLVSATLDVVQVCDIGGFGAYTPGYHAPEQPTTGPTEKADLYAFGRSLLEVAGMKQAHAEVAKIASMCVQIDPIDRPEGWVALRRLLEDAYLRATGRPAPMPIPPLAADPRQRISQAIFWREIGDLRRARALVEEAIASPGADSRCFTSHAIVLIQIGETAQGLASLRRAIELDPTFVPALAALAMYVEDPAEGLGLMERVRDLEPDHPNLASNFAALLLRLGRNDEAEAIYARTIRESNNPAHLWHEYGSHLIGQGRFDEAEPLLRKAVRANAHARNEAQREAFASSLLGLCNVYASRSAAPQLRYVARRLRRADRYAAYGSFFLACAYAWLDELELAQRYLEEIASEDTIVGKNAIRDLAVVREARAHRARPDAA